MKSKSLINGKETILITGASGFIGEHLINVLKDHYHIHAIARRTQKQVGIPLNKNIIWALADITDKNQVEKCFEGICSKHSIDYVIHLAAYYDFGNQNSKNEIYEKTNVLGTKYILELSQKYHIKHFIFASSLVASKFPQKGNLVYEKSALDAKFTYAITKQKGEEYVKNYSKHFKCSIVRLAAVFSDYCNYEPLYNFMSTWLSRSWKSQMIAGHGRMAIPYVHINCVTTILEKIIKQTDKLSDINIFLASSDKPVSILDLYLLTTHLYFGHDRRPIFVPKTLSICWVVFRNIIGILINNRPFERKWMLKYIDEELPTDCSYTRNTLDWNPKKRFDITRRMLFLIENLKSNPSEWHRKNLSRMKRFVETRPSVMLYEIMNTNHDVIVEKIYNEILKPENSTKYTYCFEMTEERLKWNINVVYNNLLTSVRHGDRSIMLNFAHDLARARFDEGVDQKELCGALITVKNVIIHELFEDHRLSEIKSFVNDNIGLSIQLAIDEIKDTFDQLSIT